MLVMLGAAVEVVVMKSKADGVFGVGFVWVLANEDGLGDKV